MTDTLTLPPSVIERAIVNDPALKSEHSRRQYAANLQAFEAWRGARDMTKSTVQAYLAELQRADLAPSTINQKLACLRWWARKIEDLAYENLPGERARVVADQAARILTIKDVRGKRPKRGRHIATEEMRALLQACAQDDTPAGARDRALFALLWTTGLRQQEARDLRTDDIAQDEDKLTLAIVGKGDKHREAYAVNGARAALEAWLSMRPRAGFVFCPIRKNGAIAPALPLSHEALRKIFRKRVILAGLEHFTPHDFRRTFAGNLLDHYDLATVQALLGHASPATTSNYDRRPAAARVKAVQSITIPEME